MSTTLELDVVNEDKNKKASTLAVFAYLLGRKSLLDPTTPRRTPEHDPVAKTQGGPFHTLNVANEGRSERPRGDAMNTYLPIHVRAISAEVDTPDCIGLEQIAGLAFANELRNRLTSSRECRFVVVQRQSRDVCEPDTRV